MPLHRNSALPLGLFGSIVLLFIAWARGAEGTDLPDDPSHTLYDDESLAPLFQHNSTVALFLGASGFGVERAGVSLISHATLDPYTMSWSSEESKIDTQIVDLIGILQAPKPRVYATMQDLYARDEMPAEDPIRTPPEKRAAELARLQVPNLPLTTIKKDGNPDEQWKVRELDAFESQALKSLKAGHALIWKDQGTSFRAVGAIRMQASCIRCHEDKKAGELLGAFTYFGFKGPRPADTDLSFEKKLAQLAKVDPYSKEFVTARNEHRSPDDTGEPYEWPVPEESVFYVDRDLARLGIVTPGMLRRQKEILADLPRKEDAEEPASDPN